MAWSRESRKRRSTADGDTGTSGRRCNRPRRVLALAPRARKVELVLINGDRRRSLLMQPGERGYFSHTWANIEEGQRYAYRLNDGPERPDPASLWQPEGVHRPSAVLRPERFAWSERRLDRPAARGPGLLRAARRHLHAGGHLRRRHSPARKPARAGRHGHRADAGGPVSGRPQLGLRRRPPLRPAEQLRRPAWPAAPGQRLPCAGVGDLAGRGLQPPRAGGQLPARIRALLLGPLSHLLGAGVQLRLWRLGRGPGLRPGQRADVDPAITASTACASTPSTPSTTPARGTSSARSRRPPTRRPAPWDARSTSSPKATSTTCVCCCLRSAAATAWTRQWSDDFHHTVHAYLTGEKHGYYVDFGPVQHFPKVLERDVRLRRHLQPATGIAATGRPPKVCRATASWSAFRTTTRSATGPAGDRLSTLIGWPAQRLAASLMLLAPHLPLLFMGEEYGEDHPFPFFCSFSGRQPDPQRPGRTAPGVRRLRLAGRGAGPPGGVDLHRLAPDVVLAGRVAASRFAAAVSRVAGGPSFLAGAAGLEPPRGAPASRRTAGGGAAPGAGRALDGPEGGAGHLFQPDPGTPAIAGCGGASGRLALQLGRETIPGAAFARRLGPAIATLRMFGCRVHELSPLLVDRIPIRSKKDRIGTLSSQGSGRGFRSGRGETGSESYPTGDLP